MIKITLCVEQTQSKLLWGVNYSNRDITSKPSFIKDLLPNAISVQKYAQVIAQSLPEYLERKRYMRAGFWSSLAHLCCRKDEVQVREAPTLLQAQRCSANQSPFWPSSVPVPEMIPVQEHLALEEEGYC